MPISRFLGDNLSSCPAILENLEHTFISVRPIMEADIFVVQNLT
ncbi:MAG: hypothetical protein Q4C96_05405 [Planctomycetia bacterium]|nr:hypothetical protein [Planctomycetia bacterium]